MLMRSDTRIKCVRRIVFHDGNFFLHKYSAGIAAGIDKMHRAAAFFFMRGKNRFMHVRSPHAYSAELRKQCRMQIHYPVRVLDNAVSAENSEPACKNNGISLVFSAFSKY